jgi:hypothetical protein
LSHANQAGDHDTRHVGKKIKEPRSPRDPAPLVEVQSTAAYSSIEKKNARAMGAMKTNDRSIFVHGFLNNSWRTMAGAGGFWGIPWSSFLHALFQQTITIWVNKNPQRSPLPDGGGNAALP